MPKLEMWNCPSCKKRGMQTRYPAKYEQAINNHLMDEHPEKYQGLIDSVTSRLLGESVTSDDGCLPVTGFTGILPWSRY